MKTDFKKLHETPAFEKVQERDMRSVSVEVTTNDGPRVYRVSREPTYVERDRTRSESTDAVQRR